MGQFSKVLQLLIMHTAPQSALDCGPGLGTLLLNILILKGVLRRKQDYIYIRHCDQQVEQFFTPCQKRSKIVSSPTRPK